MQLILVFGRIKEIEIFFIKKGDMPMLGIKMLVTVHQFYKCAEHMPQYRIRYRQRRYIYFLYKKTNEFKYV